MERKKILVADDEKDYADLIKLVLEPEGFEVRLTDNGVSAIKALKEYRPDIVILDVNMPQMDGFETLRKIRKDPEFSHLPVIFLTVRKSDSAKVRGLDVEGSDDYIVKPFKPRELTVRVKAVLRRCE